MAKKKKWKKRLGKALAVGAALAGGLALARRRATDAPGNAMASAKRAMTTDRAYTGGGYTDPIMTGGVGVKPSRRNKNFLASPRWNKGPALNPSGDVFGMDATGDIQYAMPAKGGRIVKTKKGGVARRGFGRAYLKGRK